MGRDQPRTGQAAERFVAGLLVAEGWQILDRNWRGSTGEIDLVVHRDGVLRFVEVKAREPGDPLGLESIDDRKQARLTGAAEAWTDLHPAQGGERAFLVAVVTLDPAGWTTEWVDDAF